jgi:hypothetical protein
VLPPEHILVVLYLACLVLKVPITPMDIAGRALNGDLPFSEELAKACHTLDANDHLNLTSLLTRSGEQSYSHQASGTFPCCYPRAGRLCTLTPSKLPVS